VIDFLRRLFGRNKLTAADIQTAPLSEKQLQAVTREVQKYEPPQLIVGTGQSLGRQREHNEDCLYALNITLAGKNDPLPFGIFIVADGMGGHQHGEVASEVATRTLSTTLIRRLYIPNFNLQPEPQSDPLQEVVQQGMREAQQAVLKLAPGGGTTMTAAFVFGEQVTVAHVGDSRAYFVFPDGRMQIVTRDHSLVRRLQELGQISEKEAAVHPQRNVLYRAIGQGEPFDADINTFPMPHPGYLLLCSDGLWGVVPELEIFRIITSTNNPSLACHHLVQAANAAGGPDNISVILVYYPN